MPKPQQNPNSWYVFMSGWTSHNAYLHGDMSRRSLEEAYELFKKHNPHLLEGTEK